MPSVISPPVRLGLIGCGGIVRLAHLPGLLELPELVQVTALADPLRENLDHVGAAANVPAERRYTDYRRMLEQGGLDAVVIATPHHLHAEHAIAAAEARLAVISEKPMATSLAEADAILAAVERNRVPYTISHNFLFAPAARQALDLIRSGALGTPIIGRSQCLFNKPPANVDPARWSYRKSGGGGCLIDSAYHEIYLVEAMVNSPVRSVEARVQSKFFGLDVEDVAFLLLDHANGAVSTVTGTWCLPTPDTQTFSEVHTTGDSLRITRRGLTLHRFRRVERRWDEIPVPDLAKLPEEAQSRAGHKGFFRAVLTALAQGAELPVTARQARHNLAIIAAAKQAQAERRAVEVE